MSTCINPTCNDPKNCFYCLNKKVEYLEKELNTFRDFSFSTTSKLKNDIDDNHLILSRSIVSILSKLNKDNENLQATSDQLLKQFDWKLLKDILQGIINIINSIISKIPNPNIQHILNIIVSLLQFILSLIPG